jgi:hypothetical protein
MRRTEQVQINVRSAFARARAHELAKSTGMTVVQVVEDALRGYVPPGSVAPIGRLVRRGPILVLPDDGAEISQAKADDALNRVRERDIDD